MQALLTDRCGHNGPMPHLCRLRPSLYRSYIVPVRKRPREHGHGNGEQGYGEQGCADTPSHRRIKTAAHTTHKMLMDSDFHYNEFSMTHECFSFSSSSVIC